MALPRTGVAALFRVSRLLADPIIHPHMDGRMGDNINGPSLIRAPSWLVRPLGRYYLYFADHKGGYIRLAYSDDLRGPWAMHEPGTLTLEQSHFTTRRGNPDSEWALARSRGEIAHTDDYLAPHIASPDVHVDDEARQIRMYFHGMLEDTRQVTRVAISTDGIDFEASQAILGPAYFRCFRYRDWYYALVMPGDVYRSRDGLSGFEAGPRLFNPALRHSAVRVKGDTLEVFWTQIGDAPERVHYTTVDLDGDWMDWRADEPRTVLCPELDWEGANEPVAPSLPGAIDHPVCQLRDPCLFEDGNRSYLLYCGAGERTIGIAEITRD